MAEPLIILNDIYKSFPGVKALQGVNFTLCEGEVVALCGANGAGKSTLASIIAGVYPHDGGEIRMGGKSVKFSSPKVAEKHGVGIVYQEPTLVPRMTVVENIFLGKELLTKSGLLDFSLMKKHAEETLASLGFNLDVDRKVSSLTLVEREATEIAKAVLLKPRILILDEVTAPLNQVEVEHLYSVIRHLKLQKIGIIFVSHKLNECLEICDRAVVFRDGKNAADLPITPEMDENAIISPMLGISVQGDLQQVVGDYTEDQNLPELLRTEGLSNSTNFKDISFTLRKGEILGFAGLKGAGITEMFSALQGSIPYTAGSIHINGRQTTHKTPREGIGAGIGMVTHDRHKEGLALSLDVKSNIAVSSLGAFLGKLGLVSDKKLRHQAQQYVDKLAIKTPSLLQTVANLSGGNQQKIVIAKWLLRDLDVIIVDEPTRGVDVKAKSEIFKLLLEQKANGKGVLAFSPECRELLSICDRILVISEGKIVDEVKRTSSRFNEPTLLSIIHSSSRHKGG